MTALSTRPETMIPLRRSLISKLCAGLFVALIVLPFTAPFRAWDSGTPIGKASSSDLKASEDLSNSVAVAAGTASSTPVAASGLVPTRTANGIPVRPRVLQVVLRL